jgi:hypothetical protein
MKTEPNAKVSAGPEESAPAPKSRRQQCLRRLGVVAAWLALLPLMLWTVAALRIDLRPGWLGILLILIYLGGVGTGLARSGWRRRGWAWGVGGFLIILAWWLTLKPSNDRDWQPDLAVLSYAEINGNQVTFRNIRNCDYLTATDFDVRHYDRTFDLDRLQTVDLYLVHWGSPHMAHTIVSFGFGGDDYLSFSIETRKEKGEGYSAVKGLFRQFEIMYVVADERDVVRVRTNYREGEDAYLYRLRGRPAALRNFFLEYVRRVNELHQRPEWYNAISDNCTTAIRAQRAASDRAPWNWRMLVNGHGHELLYLRGGIATNLPFAELKSRSRINDRARAADPSPDFSRLIREGLPTIQPTAVSP